jgi:diamine N-acetyltransferase
MLIRIATVADAIQLAELKRDTFRETFLHDGYGINYPPDDLAAYETNSYSVATVTDQLNDPQHRTWLVESDDGRLLGYAQVGPCKLPHSEVADDSGGNTSALPSAEYSGNWHRTSLV